MDRERPAGAAAWLRAHPQSWVAALGVIAVGLLALPDLGPALAFPDTRSYLAWPEPMVVNGVQIMGPRAPAYPLILRLLGTGAALVALQWTLSLAAWSGLGFRLARAPGAIAGALFALAPPIHPWTHAALTESISLSLLALGVFCSLALAERISTARTVGWAVVLVLLATLRDANLIVLPFLCLPLLRQPVRRAAVPIAIAAVVFVAGLAALERSERATLHTYMAIYERVRPDPPVRRWFEAQGMPAVPMNVRAVESLRAHHEWLRGDGVWVYRWWVLHQPVFYLEAWQRLGPGDGTGALPARYFDPRPELITTGPSGTANVLFSLLAAPRAIWLLGLLWPAVSWRMRGRPSALACTSAALVLGTLVLAWLSLVSDGIEIERHMLSAFVLYRVAFAVGLAAAWEIALDAWRGRASKAARSTRAGPDQA